MVTRLVRMAVVLGVVGAGCAHGPPTPAPCAPRAGARIECGPCGAPTSLDASGQRTLARQVVAAVLRADRAEGVFYDDGAAMTYYGGGDDLIADTEVRRARSVEDLDGAAKARAGEPIRLVVVELVGVAGSDAVYVSVEVTLRRWLADAQMFRDEHTSAFYCLRLRDGAIEITASAPPYVSG